MLLGVSVTDTEIEAAQMVEKRVNLRIFDDPSGKMHVSLLDVEGDLLVVSQFTLYGDTRRGRRPSYIDAAPPERANRFYQHFVEEARRQSGCGNRAASSQRDVELVNDGPVTLLLDSEKIF